MKILVINVSLRPDAKIRYLPIGLAYVISAMKRAGFEFDILDLDAHPQSPEETEKYLCTHRYDVVAMGCIVTGYKYIKWICRTIKNAFPDTTIIVGNTVAHSISAALLNNTMADIVVMGEGDETIVELLEYLKTKKSLNSVRGIKYRENGQIVETKKRPVIKNIDNIPIPEWDLLDMEVYLESARNCLDEPLPPMPKNEIRPMQINTARGCPFNCTFCYHIFREEKYRWRSGESIVKEMQFCREKYGINYFTFHDELTFFSIKQALSFANILLHNNFRLYWVASCRSGLFTEEEHLAVAKTLKEAGCLALSYSLESADPDILKWMNKKVGPDAFIRQAEILRKADLVSHTSLVFGYPIETEETIKATINICIAAGVYPSAGYLLPQPGTPMYEYAVEKGYIKDEEDYLLSLGDRQDLRLNMTRIPDDELEGILKRELARCNHELGLGLASNNLLKTGHYVSQKSV